MKTRVGRNMSLNIMYNKVVTASKADLWQQKQEFYSISIHLVKTKYSFLRKSNHDLNILWLNIMYNKVVTASKADLWQQKQEFYSISIYLVKTKYSFPTEGWKSNHDLVRIPYNETDSLFSFSELNPFLWKLVLIRESMLMRHCRQQGCPWNDACQKCYQMKRICVV